VILYGLSENALRSQSKQRGAVFVRFMPS
jgi:hypothetical protein